MRVSICTPVFNKKQFTENYLKDLSKLTTDVEIIITDNNSTDGTDEVLAKFPNVKIISNKENLGFGKASNQGYAASTGDIVLFLNNDIKVKDHQENWTQILVDAMEEDTMVGPTGGLVDPTNEFTFCYETEDNNQKINYMSGWCLAATKKTWDKLIINKYPGPFSEEFFAYYEDTDLSFRAINQGIKFKLIELPLVHFGKITSSQINTYKLYNESRQIFLKKWKNKMR